MVTAGLITAEQLQEALREQEHDGSPLGRILIARNFASAAAGANALAHQHGGLLRTEYGVAGGALPRPDAAPTAAPPILPVVTATAPIPAEGDTPQQRRRVRITAQEHKPAFLNYCSRLGAHVTDLGGPAVEVCFDDDVDDELDPYLISWGEKNRVPLELLPAEHEPPTVPAAAASATEVAPPPQVPEVQVEPAEPAPPLAPRFERAFPRGIRLGDLLVSKGFIDRGKLGVALLETQSTGKLLGRVLLEKQWIFEDELARCLSEQWNLRYVNLANVGVNRAAVRLVPRKVGLQFGAIPVRYAGDGVDVAFVDPTDDASLETIDFFVRPFNPVVATLSDITRMWRQVGQPQLG
jgi:hypothetical protein